MSVSREAESAAGAPITEPIPGIVRHGNGVRRANTIDDMGPKGLVSIRIPQYRETIKLWRTAGNRVANAADLALSEIAGQIWHTQDSIVENPRIDSVCTTNSGQAIRAVVIKAEE